MFWYNYLLWKTLTIPLHTNLQIWRNRPVQSFSAPRWPNAEGLSILQSFWSSDVKYFDLIFFQGWEPLNIYYSVLAHAAMTLCASTSHYQVQLPVPIFGVCPDSNQTAQRLQMAARKSLETMSGMKLSRLQPKYASKLVANEMLCLNAI